MRGGTGGRSELEVKDGDDEGVGDCVTMETGGLSSVEFELGGDGVGVIGVEAGFPTFEPSEEVEGTPD